ncbi:uncharacterized protein LOC134855224 isoform X2 [Symsagittifera roscoffensis]|uniref:uncharacterized protein LOC134855224 isoform X2 n=1 Tax=Symsagittifera roscoffensis TaxID=84072 RepID=UPI00307B341B
MMKQPQQQQMGGGPALSMRGAMPPMQHTLPMTHRSQYGGASKGRLGAYSAVGGGSFAPSLSSSSFFTRHNPHPNRVRHMQGLLNVPICHVSDDGFQPPQRPLMTPERRSIQMAYKGGFGSSAASAAQFPIYPTNSYGIEQRDVFHTKGVPFRKVPMLPRWFEELKDIGNRAGLEPSLALEQQQPQRASYSKTTGRLNEAPSRAMSRSGPQSRQGRMTPSQSRMGMFTGGINKQPDHEALVMECLAQILNTDSISGIQQWLVSADQREKDLVADMIRAALQSEQQQSMNEYSQQQPLYDEFLDNKATKPAQGTQAQVDRLVVAGMDEQHQQQQELQPEQPQQQMGHPAGSMDAQQMGNQQSKLPDINQPRTQSRLSDHIKMQNQVNSQSLRFEQQPALQPLTENDLEYVEYHNQNNMNDC